MKSTLRTVALVAHGVHDHGGMERALAELVRRAHGRYRFVVYSSELSEELRPLVEWKRIPVPMRPIPVKLVAFAVVAGLRLVRNRADIVHAMGAIVPNRADLASVQYCHAGAREGTGTLAPSTSPALRRLNTGLKSLLAIAAERWCYRPGRLHVLAAASNGIGEELERHYPGIPVVVTPNGVDTTRFRPDRMDREKLRDEQGAGQEQVIALFLGGDWDRKGLGIAIEALKSAPHALLWVVGPGDQSRFGSLADRCGVRQRVRFFGRRTDTERFYRAADIFVFPTQYEAFPLVALEAAASGLPLVATAAHGLSELLGDGGAGLSVARTPGSVGPALAALAADMSLRERLGETAMRRAREFTWARSAESVFATYERLLAESEPEKRAA